MEKYTEVKELGRGTYGVVTLAKVNDLNSPLASKVRQISNLPPTSTDLVVAIKRIKAQPLAHKNEAATNQGVNISALREVKLLREFCNSANAPENIMYLFDAFVPLDGSGDICAVYEFCPSDLSKVINPATNTSPLKAGDIKSFMFSLLTGIKYVHDHNSVHRDLKPDNLLFNAAGVLKIGDFGLARVIAAPGQPMSCEAITQWYKPPELLLSERFYTSSVDIWSCGCIFAELILRRPFLACEEGDIKQLEKIFSVFGCPTEENWDDYHLLPSVYRGVKWDTNGKLSNGVSLNELLIGAGEDAVECLRCMLMMHPKKRWTAEKLLEHGYFRNEPQCTLREFLPIPGLGNTN